jgi:hypothetical protein
MPVIMLLEKCSASQRMPVIMLLEKCSASQRISYASKTLTGPQLNYATIEKELLAVVFAIEKFRSYLVGTKVIVYIYHAALKYLLMKKDGKQRLI